ncbi:MAG: alpha/beta fold hydrolase [Myxococcaceae bacterium]
MLVFFCAVAQAQELPEQGAQQVLARRKVVASDGAALALYRYQPAGGGSAHPAILLIPDVGYSLQVYDFQARGLARFLQSSGRDVFVVELRGQGKSSAPAQWSLLDWVERDLPASVAAVQLAHPGPVDLVVQGFGGSLVLAATTKELLGKVGRVIAFSPPVAAEVPNETVRGILEAGGRFSGVTKEQFELIFARGGKFSWGVAKEFRSTGLGDLSPKAASELLGWMESGELRLRDGSTFSARIAQFERPALWFLPLGDNFAHAEFGSQIRDVAVKAKVTPQELSKFELFAEDYTHLSMLLGSSAEDDVFKRIVAFLNATEPALTAGDVK